MEPTPLLWGICAYDGKHAFSVRAAVSMVTPMPVPGGCGGSRAYDGANTLTVGVGRRVHLLFPSGTLALIQSLGLRHVGLQQGSGENI
eukprot:730532-Pelagomonas_calceolata.AAC.1